MRNLLRTLFSFDNLMITLLTCVAIWLLTIVPQNFDFLNPVSQALGDMDLTDMVFSKFRDESEVQADTNIVIVNIGMLDRAGIAAQLDRINEQQPMAVGIDAFFRYPKAPEGDSALAASMARTRNLVLVSKVGYRDVSKNGVTQQWEAAFSDYADKEFDTLERSDPMFLAHARTGFANLIIDQEAAFMTCREVSLHEQYRLRRRQHTMERSFALELAHIVSPPAAERAMQRSESVETINFRGNLDKYYHFDAEQVLDPETDLSILRGKIVLMGMLGPDLNTKSFDDNFFTPLNERYVGRTYPDMYGVVVHANVLSMILHGTYIDRMSDAMSYALALLVLVFNVLLFTFIYRYAENWYDTLALALQLGQSLLMLYITITVFDEQSYKLALTPALVCVALVGTVHDLYQDSIRKIILSAVKRIRRKTASNSDSRRTPPPLTTEHDQENE